MLHAPARIAAVDHGTKRVGVAVADALGLSVQPVGTYAPDAAVGALRAMHAAHPLGVIVVGWPLEAGGVEGAATRRVTPFVNRLRRAFPGVGVVTHDERHTSTDAAAFLGEAGRARAARRSKGLLDAAAACVLLQDWLAERENSTAVRPPAEP